MSNGSVKLIAAAVIGGVVMLGSAASWADCAGHSKGQTVQAPTNGTPTSTASTTTAGKPAGG